MAENKKPEVPDGAAVFPLIPAELDVHPLLLALMHGIVFLSGSEKTVVDPPAAEEALEYVATYLQRLSGRDLDRLRLDVETLLSYAKAEKWRKQEVEFLRNFLVDYGVSAKIRHGNG
jgi:hypothetical protein